MISGWDTLHMLMYEGTLFCGIYFGGNSPLNMWTETFQMYKLDLEKKEEPQVKLPTSIGS